MGSTFANLQVRVPARAAGGDDPMSGVRVIYDRLLADEGLVPTQGDPDRSVLLVRSGEWLSIYDEAGDTLADGATPFTTALSAALGPAIAVQVHDSDVLLLELAVAGSVVDAYDSNPEFSGEGKRSAPGPHVKKWAKALGVSEDGLRPVFTHDGVFAEEALTPLAQALGLPRDRLGTGFRYLEQDGEVPPDAVRLGYRLAKRPAVAAAPSGPPRLEVAGAAVGGAVRPTEAAVGASLGLSLTSRNAGGPGVGLRVELEGPPWYTPTAVGLVLGSPMNLKGAHPPGETPVGGDGRWTATFADAAIPGAPPPIDPFALERLGIDKAMAHLLSGQVHVNVSGTTSAAGEGVVRIRVVPLGHGAGAVGGFPIAARETTGRPLRAPPTVHPTQLAPLASREIVVALVVGLDAARLAQIPSSVPMPDTAKVRWTVFPRGKAPKLKTGKADGFLGAPWQKLAADVPAVSGVVHAEWVDGAEDREPHGVVELGVGIIPSPRALPALAVSVGPRGDRDAAERCLADAIDRLAAEGGLVQALLVRWGWHGSIEGTPYEQASSVMGQCTLERPWAERWLRGVGAGTLWLGPALAAYVPDLDASRVGEVARITVADVPQIERALAPILPGAAEWQAGVMARYR